MPANPIGRMLRTRRAGHHKLVWERPELQAPESFTLTSPAFENGTPIPEKYKGRIFGRNVSPGLNWTTPPAGTAELVLLVEDPDVPMGNPGTHASVVGIDPGLGGLPDGGLSHPSDVPGIRLGKGALGHRGWGGPLPPRSHGSHDYVFEMFAVDTHVVLPEKFGVPDVVKAITGHVLARAKLVGTFEIV